VTRYLVRHGTAAPGPADRGRPLTPEGRAEIEATARALVGHGVQITEICHSDLVRARESAEILSRVLATAMVGETEVGRVHFAPGTAVGLRRSAIGWQLDLIVPASGRDRS
jgi:phosphohistidine phosphatase SixA